MARASIVILVACGAAPQPTKSPDSAPPPEVAVPAAPPSLTPAPPATWEERCAERLRQAQQQGDPRFAQGTVSTSTTPRGAHFVGLITDDPEHVRFHDKEPAKLLVDVVEQTSEEAGELVPTIEAPGNQASLNIGWWTTTRAGSLEVQLVTKQLVRTFRATFEPAVHDCLK